jgi:hypothetical protein
VTPGRAFCRASLSGVFLFLWTGEVKQEHPDILEKTMAFWGKRTGKSFSREEAREMVANISGFFQVLAEWDRKARMEIHKQPRTHEQGKT